MWAHAVHTVIQAEGALCRPGSHCRAHPLLTPPVEPGVFRRSSTGVQMAAPLPESARGFVWPYGSGTSLQNKSLWAESCHCPQMTLLLLSVRVVFSVSLAFLTCNFQPARC